MITENSFEEKIVIRMTYKDKNGVPRKLLAIPIKNKVAQHLELKEGDKVKITIANLSKTEPQEKENESKRSY